MRKTYDWKQKAEEIKQKALYLCEVCKDKGEIRFDHLEVHHITPLKQDSSLLLDNNNLVCLCAEHHIKAENGLIDADYLRQLALRREENNPPMG